MTTDYEKDARELTGYLDHDMGIYISSAAKWLKERDAARDSRVRAEAYEDAARIVFNAPPPGDWSGHTGRYGGWLKGVHQFKNLLFAKAASLAEAGRKP